VILVINTITCMGALGRKSQLWLRHVGVLSLGYSQHILFASAAVMPKDKSPTVSLGVPFLSQKPMIQST
jgi:hypothetical protein